MQKQELKKEIDALIDSIKKQADRMNTEDSLSKVELELFHHKIQKLYEKSILIHHLPAPEERSAPSQAVQPVEETKTIIPIRYPAEETMPVSPKEEPQKQDFIADSIPSVKPITPEVKRVPETKTGSDLFGSNIQAESKMTFRMKAEKEKAPKIVRKPIPDLKVAIGVNDKFRYINELFHGNSTEYHIALNQINTCSGFEEADIYLANIGNIYEWKEDNEVVDMFFDLVQRRFL